MSSLDGQGPWRDLWNRLDAGTREDYFRLNVDFMKEGPAMDDVSRMDELRGLVQGQTDVQRTCQKVAFALLVSAFFFELSSTPLFYGGRYYCKGTIRCRLHGKTICRAMEKVEDSRLVFMTEHEILGYFQSFQDLCVGCERYVKTVEFIVRHPSDPISIYMQSSTRRKRRLSAFPQSMQWFVQQQHLEARYGFGDQLRPVACDVCEASQIARHHSAMPKRKRTAYHSDESRPSKRQRSAAALETWYSP